MKTYGIREGVCRGGSSVESETREGGKECVRPCGRRLAGRCLLELERGVHGRQWAYFCTLASAAPSYLAVSSPPQSRGGGRPPLLVWSNPPPVRFFFFFFETKGHTTPCNTRPPSGSSRGLLVGNAAGCESPRVCA
jgi:hypothetical protein